MQDFAFVLDESHEVPFGPFFQSIEVLKDGSPALSYVDSSSQFGVMYLVTWLQEY